jgi:hypothetical protein
MFPGEENIRKKSFIAIEWKNNLVISMTKNLIAICIAKFNDNKDKFFRFLKRFT